MKYQNKRNGHIASIIETNEKFKTVMLQPEDDYQDGKPFSLTLPTFKRWWKPIEDEDISSDGTPYSQVMAEIIAQEKQEVDDIMEAKRKAGVEVMDIDPKKVEIVSEKKEVPERDSVKLVVHSIKNSQFSNKYSMNKRGLLVKGLYIVFRKYGIRVYMKPETYVKLTFCTSIKYKASDTNNKMLPKSIAVPNDNIEETLGIIFNNM